VGLAVSSVGLPGFSSPSSPLTLGAAVAALFFLKVAGTISAGRPKDTLWLIRRIGRLTEFFNEESDSLVGNEVISPLPYEYFLKEAL
jgi:hypothetical protein